MKQLSMIIVTLTALFGLRHFQVIEISAAKFEYDSIHTTLYNTNQYGSPNIIKERSSFNRWYEDATVKVWPSEEVALQPVINDLSQFHYHIHLGEGRHISTSGDSLEICLDHISYDLVELETGFFTSRYKASITADLDYFLNTPSESIPLSQYALQMKATVNTSGLRTEQFLKYNFESLFLHELDRLSADYFSENEGSQ